MNMTPEAKMRAFRILCRVHLKLPVWVRCVLGFRLEKRRIPGDRQNRAFNTMAEYREWCHKNMPRHLGYRIVGRDD
jgi:hypothetical protein